MKLLEKIASKKATVGIIGLGYVGLPTIGDFLQAGFRVIGFDEDVSRVESLMAGKSYIKHIHSSLIQKWLAGNKFHATAEFAELSEVDVKIICVPTPINENQEPELSCILNAVRQIAKYLQKGQLIILESTTYPGTTDENVRAILEETGLKVGKDYYLGYSPERQDPNNTEFTSRSIPKIVSGYTQECFGAVIALYDAVSIPTVPVSSTRVAEAAKLLENIYRSVNIALVNELKMLFDRMEIDIWEVIEAAKTKPFGFQAFYPGPGLGGHCIPVDPYYLTWKAHEYDFHTGVIESAGDVNKAMPHYIEKKIFEVLNGLGKAIKGSKIIILGIAYKKDIDDPRESPAFPIMDLLLKNGAKVSYNDPYIPVSKGSIQFSHINMHSVKLTEEIITGADLILLITDHSDYDYALIERHAKCIVDTRNAFERQGIRSKKIYKA
ncbi:MAG: nucleotide sugar dehydrogenase [Pseudomonadota bacterium]